MPKKLVKTKLTSVPVRLSPEQLGLLDRLVRAGLLGTSRTEICKHWVIEELRKIYPEEFRGGPG